MKVGTVNSTLELKPGERVRFASGSEYLKAPDGSLRRGHQKLNKKQRRAARGKLRLGVVL